MTNLKNLKDPTKIAYQIALHLNISIFEKQELLEIINLKKRLEKLMEHISNEINVISVERKNKRKSKKPNGKNTKRILFE